MLHVGSGLSHNPLFDLVLKVVKKGAFMLKIFFTPVSKFSFLLFRRDFPFSRSTSPVINVFQSILLCKWRFRPAAASNKMILSKLSGITL